MFEGVDLGPDDYVISVEHPTRPLLRGDSWPTRLTNLTHRQYDPARSLPMSSTLEVGQHQKGFFLRDCEAGDDVGVGAQHLSDGRG